MKIDGVKVVGPVFRAYKEILTPEALRFLGKLAREFEPKRQELLEARKIRQKEIDNGKLPDFLPETQGIRESEWTVAPIRPDLEKRIVELTGPVDRKMIINALNSKSDTYMSDFEDANAPSWKNNIEGQINLRDAINGNITYKSPEGKKYEVVNKTPPKLIVRGRGLHMNEEHVTVDGKPISAMLFDLGLFLYHNAKALINKGSGPYFYTPKFESHLENRLLKEVFQFSEDENNIPKGYIRATNLIETITAAFEMDEFLYELKDYSAGLNAGRWDYLFSFIKKFKNHPEFVLPDRSELTMEKPPLNPYLQLLIQTAHKRGIHGIGGMVAKLLKGSPEEIAKTKTFIKQDKLLEANAGADGAWAASPGEVIDIIREAFEEVLKGRPHQIENKRPDVKVTAKELLTVPQGKITEAGVRKNVRASVLYLQAWLKEIGCVAIDNAMEDAATVEISRSQLWQWLEHKAKLDDDRTVTMPLLKTIINEELQKIKSTMKEEELKSGKLELATELLENVINKREFSDFITLEAYPHIVTKGKVEEVETKEEFIKRVEDDWKNNPRWEGINRPYSAEEIWMLRGSEPNDYSDANEQARKAWNIVRKRPVATMGTVHGHDAVQMLTSAAGLAPKDETDLSFFDIIYIGGWQSAAEKNTDKTTFSDLLFYGASTVPDNGEEVGNVLDMLDKIFQLNGENKIQWKVPLIADADTGYGDKKSAGVHMKRFIERNIAGVHFEDQVEKRCGHLAGKTLMTTKQFEQILEGAMEMRDIMGTETILIARTDAEAAKYIVNDSDERDRQFIDYSKGRTEKGYFYLKEGAGLEMAIQRGLAAAPYADMIWFETHEPDLEQALKFAEAIHKVHPGKMLAYNLSPSFNWDDYFTNKVLKEMGLNKKDYEDEKVKEKVDIEVFRQAAEFILAVGKAGFVFNFQTYASFRIKNLAIWKYARGFRQNGMAEWVKFEREEKEAEKHGYIGRKAQSLVGGNYWERFGKENIVTGSTQDQFKDRH